MFACFAQVQALAVAQLLKGPGRLANLTVLWDYSPCVGTNTMRSVSQFFSICALLLFNASFVLDFGGSVVGERELTAIPRRETA